MESSAITKHVREARVLVLYTGGTIGMKKTDGGELCEDFEQRVLSGLRFYTSWIVSRLEIKLVCDRCVKLCFN